MSLETGQCFVDIARFSLDAGTVLTQRHPFPAYVPNLFSFQVCLYVRVCACGVCVCVCVYVCVCMCVLPIWANFYPIFTRRSQQCCGHQGGHVHGPIHIDWLALHGGMGDINNHVTHDAWAGL